MISLGDGIKIGQEVLSEREKNLLTAVEEARSSIKKKHEKIYKVRDQFDSVIAFINELIATSYIPVKDGTEMMKEVQQLKDKQIEALKLHILKENEEKE